jgi:hypothetical protein
MIGKIILHYKIEEKLGESGNFPSERDKLSRRLFEQLRRNI